MCSGNNTPGIWMAMATKKEANTPFFFFLSYPKILPGGQRPL